MPQRSIGVPETGELKELAQLLVTLFDAAQRLREGSERQEAINQIGGFHRRLVALIGESDPESLRQRQ
jgi:hypothetical protein